MRLLQLDEMSEWFYMKVLQGARDYGDHRLHLQFRAQAGALYRKHQIMSGCAGPARPGSGGAAEMLHTTWGHIERQSTANACMMYAPHRERQAAPKDMLELGEASLYAQYLKPVGVVPCKSNRAPPSRAKPASAAKISRRFAQHLRGVKPTRHI